MANGKRNADNLSDDDFERATKTRSWSALGQKADIATDQLNVRFAPKSGH
jgi:hypothetical protein